MKKILLLIVFAVSIAFYSKAQFSVGGGLGYGSEIENLGIFIRGQYEVNDEIDIAGGFTYFFPKDPVTMWTINIDGHYNFEVSDQFEVYPLAGINITGVTVDLPAILGGKTSESEFGLNIGGGGAMGINDKVSLFGEIKYVISDADQLVIGAGILIAL